MRKDNDYSTNIDNMIDYITHTDMTQRERYELKNWVYKGNDISSNPWDYRDKDGLLLDYLQAYRIWTSDTYIPQLSGYQDNDDTECYICRD